MAIMADFWYYVISGFLLMLVPIGFVNWWLRGFFWSYMKVKASGGKLCLVRVRSVLRDYYRPGFVKDKTLQYKDSTKEQRTINIPDRDFEGHDIEFFYRTMGVTAIDVDEEKNCPFKLDGKGVTGFDAAKFDSILQRALLKPAFGDKKLLIILIIVILLLLTSLASMYYNYQNNKMLLFLINQSIQQASHGVIA